MFINRRLFLLLCYFGSPGSSNPVESKQEQMRLRGMPARLHRRHGPVPLKTDYDNRNSNGMDAATPSILLRSLVQCSRESRRPRHSKQNILRNRDKGSRKYRRQLDLASSALGQLAHMGVAGTIDIMSPTVDAPLGEMIASLSLSTDISNATQFELTPPNTSSTTFYLTVANLAPEDGNILTNIKVPVYDKVSASYVVHCATFDINSSSPLVAMECTNKEGEVSTGDGQLFSYSPTTGALKPLQLYATVSDDTSDSMRTEAGSLAPDDISSAYSSISRSTSIIQVLSSSFQAELYSSSTVSNPSPSDLAEEATSMDYPPITLPTNTASNSAAVVVNRRMTNGATPSNSIGLAGSVVLPTASNHAASAIVTSSSPIIEPKSDRRSNLDAFQDSKRKQETTRLGRHYAGNMHDIVPHSHLRRSQRTVDTGYIWKFTPADIIDR